MPRFAPYLQKRGFSHGFRIAVPPDLRALIGEIEVTRTLGVSDKAEASAIALECAALMKRLFVALRTAMAVDEVGQEGGDGARADALQELVKTAKQRLELLSLKDDHFKQLVAHQRTHIRQRQEQEERHRGELELAKLQAQVDALKGVVHGVHASPSVGLVPPSAASLALQATPDEVITTHRLAELLPIWERLKAPAISSIEVYKSAVIRFERWNAELPIEALKKKDISDYVQWLMGQGLSPKTISKEYGVVRALLTIAESQGLVDSNVASKVITPSDGGAQKVRAYKPEECLRIFSSAVFVDGARPTAGKGEAAYWIPLLLLYTGARRDEIAQLTVDRVISRDGVHGLLLDSLDEGGLKTAQSKRVVPLHDGLLRLDFLKYVSGIRSTGGGMLFPRLTSNARGQYGAKWGDWWGRYVREEVGIKDSAISPAHSFRHLFITECRIAKIPSDYARVMVGHVSGVRRDAHDGYGEFMMKSLKDEVDKIDFRGLDLGFLCGK